MHVCLVEFTIHNKQWRLNLLKQLILLSYDTILLTEVMTKLYGLEGMRPRVTGEMLEAYVNSVRMQTLIPHIARMAEKLGILSRNPKDIQNTCTFRRNVQGLLDPIAFDLIEQASVRMPNDTAAL